MSSQGPHTVVEAIRFRSRIDAWLIVVLFGPLGAALWGIASRYRDDPTWGRIRVGLLLLGVTALMLWIVLDTSYLLSASTLPIRTGPLRWAVPCKSIRRVRRSRTLLAGPALSLRRLELDYGTYDTAIVSPSDIDGFIAALRLHNPGIEVT